jgi:hypothetical protein
LSGEGNTALVGGYGDAGRLGAVWVFTRNGKTWTQQGGKLVPNGLNDAAQCGTAVAISADGNTAIVTGPNNDGVGVLPDRKLVDAAGRQSTAG